MKGASCVNLCVLNFWSFSSMQLSDKRPDVEPMIFTFQENQSSSFGASAPSLLARTLTHTLLAKSFPTLLDFFQYL